MLQKKDEQRSVELEQNEHSSTNADVTMSSSHSAKPFVMRSHLGQPAVEYIKLECLKIAASYAGCPEAVKRLYKEFVELLY